MKFNVLTGIFVLLFAFCAVRAQEGETDQKLSAADQRRIIAVLLSEKFERAAEDVIYISTANLPAEVRRNFPGVENKTIRLISPEQASEREICAYEFGEFQFIEKFVSVSFGNCREGLAYDFLKVGDRWKTVGLTVTRELFY